MMLEDFPTRYSPSDFGLGRTAHFPMPLQVECTMLSDLIYVYAESRLSREPQDPEVGFTEDDVHNTTGVHVFGKVKNRFHGEIFPLSALLGVLTDLSLRSRIIHRVYEMADEIQLDEEFLEAVNTDGEASKCASIQMLH